jgi:hypothetical protein
MTLLDMSLPDIFLTIKAYVTNEINTVRVSSTVTVTPLCALEPLLRKFVLRKYTTAKYAFSVVIIIIVSV